MKKKKLIAVAVCVVLAASLFSGFSLAGYNPPENGWYVYGTEKSLYNYNKDYDRTYYYRDGAKVESWQKIDGKWYYFAPLNCTYESDRGVMYQWAPVGEYFVGDDGAMVTNMWREQLQFVFHPNADVNEMHTSESFDPPRWEYYGEDGRRVYGWKQIDGVWYYFHEGEYEDNIHEPTSDGGILAMDEWEQVNGKWYLFGEDGAMLTGEQERDGKSYLLSDSGAMYTGWKQLDDGSWIYYKADGAMAKDEWVMVKNKWYLFDAEGIMRTGLLERYDHTYYFSDSGSMATGWKKLDGVWYYFRPADHANGPQGSMVKDSWVLSGNKWYYIGSDGIMVTGTKDIYSGNYGKSDEYYFNDSGAMQTGWHHVNGNWHFYRTSSSANGPQGSMAKGVWVPAGSFWYFTDYTDGAMVLGWKDIGTKTYYFSYDASHYGQMVTGKQVIDGKAYTFDDDGALVK